MPKGSIKSIITKLHTQENLKLTQLDAYFLALLGRPQSGWIDMGAASLTRADFLYKLTRAKAALVKVKMIPGETTYNILKALSIHYHIPLNVLQKEYDRLAPYPEGVLFPDTYYLPRGMEGRRVLEYLVQEGLRRHKRLSLKVFGVYREKEWFTKIVTIASIIQKEAANEKEMPLISAVIYNRLKKGMPLQMDGALNYGAYSHLKITAQRIRNDSSRFNTYKYKGLPPYPVSLVSIEAIKAAISPAKVDYLYFVRGPAGRHLFSKSYRSHLKNIKNVKKRNKKIKN